MRFKDNSGQVGAGIDLVADPNSPDDQLRVWVDGEEAPRFVLESSDGTIRATDGNTQAGAGAMFAINRRFPKLIHVGDDIACGYVNDGKDFPARPLTVGGLDTVTFRNVLDGASKPMTASCVWLGRDSRDDPTTGGLHFDDTDGALEAFRAALNTAVTPATDDGYVWVSVAASGRHWTRMSPSSARVIVMALDVLLDDTVPWNCEEDEHGQPVAYTLRGAPTPASRP